MRYSMERLHCSTKLSEYYILAQNLRIEPFKMNERITPPICGLRFGYQMVAEKSASEVRRASQPKRRGHDLSAKTERQKGAGRRL